jgi:hypothetical protein
VYYASFRNFAQLLLRVEQEKAFRVKKKMLQDYYSASNAADKKSIENIMSFVR